ncbi:MAG: prepilin-type N-terminal cleavage/methylation domain-containing protein [Candidatus Pacebacteria bacterium]|nr:prepilin-type N-terminal cleavage/methylation domain-containing protein [Candidatus Paceibacterota bacterium]MCF7857497.1 prepilin-type N-terminal cleavage/methylation domain-containing protein [Candidatus Paceibacterota bacterium]
MRFFSRSFSAPFSKGFTLVELLVSIAIIGIVTSIVLLKYNTFDSTVLLKGVAYEIALTLRDAQVKSISAIGTSGEFSYPYGVTFNTGSDSKRYTVFRYESTTYGDDPYYSSPAVDVLTTIIDRSMHVSEICIYGTPLGDPCSVDRLDVSFRRPEFNSIFYADATGGPFTDIVRAEIKVNSVGNPLNVFVVEVSQFGQISIYKQ